MAIKIKGDVNNAVKVIYSSGTEGLGPQGIQGDPGAAGEPVSEWTLDFASGPSDVYPDAGRMKLYDAVSFQLAVNSVNDASGDTTPWLASMRSFDVGSDPSFVAVVEEGDPTVYRFGAVDTVSPLYPSSGSYASILTMTILEQGGSLTQGSKYVLYHFPIGLVGHQGHQGTQGARGTQGSQGSVGFQGESGPRGVEGVPSDYGDPGPQGAQGRSDPGYPGAVGFPGEPSAIQGPQGPQGFLGPQGPTPSWNIGPEGEAGYQGAQGPQGNDGFQGIPGGIQGAQGVQGDPGPQGGFGELGRTGARGVLGSQGFQGDFGPQGVQGPVGNVGAQGPQGNQGIQGEGGQSGLPGDQGPQGYQGASGAGFVIAKVYDSDAARAAAAGGDLPADGQFGLVAGTLPTSDPDYGKLYLYNTSGGWTFKTDMSVEGFQGSTGTQGTQGHPGTQGSQGSSTTGVDGSQGHQGHPGAQGAQGFQGQSDGYQGIQGVQGVVGAQGSSVYAPSGTGLVYSVGNISSPVDTLTLGLGLTTSGSAGSRYIYVPGALARPSLDANHIHVYNCSEASGATVLTDSGSGAKNMSISGSAGTDYYLSSYRVGTTVPGIMFLKNGSSILNGGAFASGCNITGPDFSMEAVITVPYSTSTGHAVMRLKNTANNIYVHLSINGSGGLYAGVSGIGAADTGAISVVYGTPQHVLVTTSKNFTTGATTVRLYIDGILRASNNTTSIGTLPTMTQVMIGQDNVTSGYSLRACFRDVRISNTTRTAAYALSSANSLLAL